MQIVQTRNSCLIHDELYFMLREIELGVLLKCSLSNGKTTVATILEDNGKYNRYGYSSLFAIDDNNIVIIPYYADSYVFYSVKDQKYSFLKTKNSSKYGNFENTYVFDHNIVCIPSVTVNPMVILDPRGKTEEMIDFPSDIVNEGNQVKRMFRLSESIVGFPIFPDNKIVYFDIRLKKTWCERISGVENRIDAICFVNDKMIGHCQGENKLFLINENRRCEDMCTIQSDGRIEFLGIWGESLLVDVISNPIKYLINVSELDQGVSLFDESIYGSKNIDHTYGFIQEFPGHNSSKLYFSGYSESLYYYEGESLKRTHITLDEDEIKKINGALNNKIKRERLVYESREQNLFRLIDSMP